MDVFHLVGKITLEGADKVKSQINETSDEAGKGTSKMHSAFKKVGKAVVGAFAVDKMVRFGAESVRVAAEFDDSMRNVQALSGATGKQFDQLHDKAIELGSTTAWKAKDVADAMGYMALAGYDTNQILAATPSVLALASASQTDLARTSDIVTDAITAFGDSAQDSARYADVLATAQARSNTTVDMLGEAFKYAAPVAGTYKFRLEDVSTALGMMANAGVKGSMAGTSLASIMTRLGTNTNGARDTIEALGIEFYNADGTARPLNDIMLDLCDATADMNQQEKAELATKIAGKEAQKGLTAILNQGSDAYKDLAKAIDGSGGSAQKMADTMEKGLGGAIRSLGSAWESFKIQITENIEAKDTGISKVILGLADFLREDAIPAFKHFENIVRIVGGAIMGALGPALKIAGKGIKALGKGFAQAGKFIEKHPKLIGTLVKALVAYVAINRTVNFGTAGLAKTFLKVAGGGGKLLGTLSRLVGGFNPVVLAITAVITVGVLLYKNWDKIKKAAGKLKEGVVKSVGKMKESVGTHFDNMKTKMTDTMGLAVDGVKTRLDNMKTAYKENGGGIKGLVAGTMEGVKGYYKGAYNVINAMTGGHLGKIVGAFRNKMGSVKGHVSGAMENIKSKFSGGLGGALTTTRTKMGNIADSFKNKMGNARDYVKGAIDKIKGFFNFSWSLPKLKLPHFSVSGKFSLKPPSVPKFGVSWYAKAMQEPYLFTKPTLFQTAGGLKGAGEAGDEMIYGRANLLKDIEKASGSGQKTELLVEKMDKIIKLLADCEKQLNDRGIYLDGDKLVGEIAPRMNNQLGTIAARR